METETPMFPQARLDQMTEAARNFNSQSPPANLLWRLDNANLDGVESAFVARQLEFMRPGLFEVQYPSLKGQMLVPTNTTVDPGAEQVTITIVDQSGEVKPVHALGSDIPSVEVKATQKSMNFFTFALSYAYSQQEARAAIFARMPLLPRKAMATRDQMARKMDDIYFVGETITGLKGLINQSGTETYSVPATGSGASKTWETKDSDAVILDLNQAPAQMVTNSKEIWIPDTMVLPLSSFQHIGGRRVGDGTTETILSYFMRTTAWIKQVESTYKLETAGGSSDKRMVVYKKDPTVLEHYISMMFEQLPPQAVGLEVRTICQMRTAGVAVYQPKALLYGDGV